MARRSMPPRREMDEGPDAAHDAADDARVSKWALLVPPDVVAGAATTATDLPGGDVAIAARNGV